MALSLLDLYNMAIILLCASYTYSGEKAPFNMHFNNFKNMSITLTRRDDGNATPGKRTCVNEAKCSECYCVFIKMFPTESPLKD